MSYYYRYNFVSPEPVYANVKEEFKSYFDTGAVDDTMFGIWTGWCLQKLGKATYPIVPSLIRIENYKSRLPDDFHAVREAWAVTEWNKDIQAPSAVYNQLTLDGIAIGNTNNIQGVCDTALRLDNSDIYCNPCDECGNPDFIQAIYKLNNSVLLTFKRTHLLTPGNIDNSCPNDMWCANRNAISCDSYDIRDNKLIVTYPKGVVYLLYYSNAVDDIGYQLIPDLFRIKEYIGRFLKEKTMEMLLNQSTDESFNQLKYKYELYKAKADEALILADTELKKGDIYRQKRMVDRVRRTNRRYNIW